MQLILALLLSVVVLAGAAPRSMQEELERCLPWWHSRLMGAVSSFVEFFFGWQMLRQVLLRHGLEVLGTVGAWVLGSIAFFLLSEGILRLGVTLRKDEYGMPSLIAVLLVNAIKACRRRMV